MTSIVLPKGNKKALEQFIEVLKELHQNNDLVITSDLTNGAIYSPTKKRKYYRTLSFRLAPDLFTKKGHNTFHKPNEYRTFGIFFFKEGIIDHKEEKKG